MDKLLDYGKNKISLYRYKLEVYEDFLNVI